jgi:hypothetical protein
MWSMGFMCVWSSTPVLSNLFGRFGRVAAAGNAW